MLPVTQSDIWTLARVLYAVPPAQRWSLADAILTNARAAYLHKLSGAKTMHPDYGDGSVHSAALTGDRHGFAKVGLEPLSDPMLNPDWAHALKVAISACTQGAQRRMESEE